MNLTQMRNITEKLNSVLMQTFDFCGLRITLNYAERAKHSKSWTIPPHFHPWFEFNYVSKGSLYTTINEDEFTINQGDSFLIPPGVRHSHRHNNCGDDGICIRFGLSCENENRVLDLLSLPRAQTFNSEIEKINLSGGTYAIQAEFAAWLMRIFDIWNTTPPPQTPTKNTFASQVILYLEEYFREKIKVCDIANALNTSYRTLARKFSSETGMSISEKLTDIRINHAKQLLISTDLSIYNIAISSGFDNEFYFSKLFKQKENIPPKTYRLLHKIEK